MEIQQYNPRCVLIALQIAFGDKEEQISRFCRQSGIEMKTLLAPKAHLTPEQFERIWTGLQDVFQSPNVGLLQGQRLGLAMGGFANLIAQVSPTLQVALKQFGQYHALFTDPSYYERFEVEERSGESYLEITFSPVITEQSPVFARSTAECMFVVAMRALTEYGKRPIKPVRLCWAFEPPAGWAIYQEIFGCPMQFGRPYNRMYFSGKDLQRPVVTHNAVLYQHFLQVMESHLAQQRSESFPYMVRTAVLKRLNNIQGFTIEEIADELHVSVRSLQRRLEQDQTVFQQIAEDVRREVALQLVQRGHHNFNQIASLIGYTEPSSFRRAFKRWTGKTPRTFQTGLA